MPPYDLGERTYAFAQSTFEFIRRGVTKTVFNTEIIPQLIRSSASVGANYIEANESLGKKDFLMRLKICRKEAKESIYWLRLLELILFSSDVLRRTLISEAEQLIKIFSSIILNSKI